MMNKEGNVNDQNSFVNELYNVPLDSSPISSLAGTFQNQNCDNDENSQTKNSINGETDIYYKSFLVLPNPETDVDCNKGNQFDTATMAMKNENSFPIKNYITGHLNNQSNDEDERELKYNNSEISNINEDYTGNTKHLNSTYQSNSGDYTENPSNNLNSLNKIAVNNSSIPTQICAPHTIGSNNEDFILKNGNSGNSEVSNEKEERASNTITQNNRSNHEDEKKQESDYFKPENCLENNLSVSNKQNQFDISNGNKDGTNSTKPLEPLNNLVEDTLEFEGRRISQSIDEENNIFPTIYSDVSKNDASNRYVQKSINVNKDTKSNDEDIKHNSSKILNNTNKSDDISAKRKKSTEIITDQDPKHNYKSMDATEGCSYDNTCNTELSNLNENAHSAQEHQNNRLNNEDDHQNPSNIHVTANNSDDIYSKLNKSTEEFTVQDQKQNYLNLSIMSKEELTNSIPLGLSNPKAYCYLNSILQVFFTCSQFRNHMINFYMNNRQDTNDSDLQFVCTFGELLEGMLKKDKSSVQNSLTRFHKNFENSNYGDDIHKCYLQILTKVNRVLKHKSETKPHSNEIEKTLTDAETTFKKYRSQNPGFVFELFSGQISFETKCEKCERIHNKRFQLFKSLPLQVPASRDKIFIEKCIENFFLKSEIIDGEYKCCDSPKIVFISQFTHAPKYLLIYLVRGAYNSYEMKKDTFITFDRHIVVPTISGNVFYKVQSVIDHFGGNESGHYFVKSYNGTWWLKNDFQVKEISWPEVVTKHSIGLLLELETDEDKYFDQHPIPVFKSAVLSTIQMLYSCTAVRKILIKYYSTFKYKSQITENTKFIKNLGELFYFMEENKIKRARYLFGTFQDNFMDTHKKTTSDYFMEILKRLKITDNIISDNIDSSIKNTDQNNKEFDFFSLIIWETYICKYCNTETTNQEISQCLKFDENKDIHLLAAIDKYFQYSEINVPEKECIICKKNTFTLIREVKNVPKYLFFDLHYSNKFKILIDFDTGITFPLISGHVSYTLIAVLLLSETHYYTKYLDKDWMDSEELEPKKMLNLSFNKNHVVGLMMEQTDKNDDFRTSKNYKTILNVNPEDHALLSTIDKECGDNIVSEDTKRVISLCGIEQTDDGHLNKFENDETKPVLVNKDQPSFNTPITRVPTVNVANEIGEYEKLLFGTFDAINSTHIGKQLSVIISMLYTCVSFREHIIEFHNSDRIVKIDSESRNDIDFSDVLFVNDFCRLFFAMHELNLMKIKELTKTLETYFLNYGRSNVQQFYDFILNTINLITREFSQQITGLADGSEIERFRSKNNGFICDLFVSLLSVTTICETCNEIHCQEHHQIKHISISLTTNQKFDNLEECVRSCYMNYEPQMNYIYEKYNCCRKKKIRSIRKFVYAPKYLFIYLHQINQINILDKFSEFMVFEKSDGTLVRYSVCAVIDQSGKYEYSLSTYMPVNNYWKKLTFSHSTHITKEEIINKFNIGFLLKRTDDIY